MSNSSKDPDHDFHSQFLARLVNKKLEERVMRLINELDSMPYDIVANRELDKFYYMQKLTEMRLLDDKLYEALERVSIMMAGRYDTRREVMTRWKRDVRWLTFRRSEFNAVEE